MTTLTQSTGSVAGNQVPDSFWAQVLTDLNAPVTPTNIASLKKWSTFENTIAAWNPLASEQNIIPNSVASTGIPGAPAVQNYNSQSAGAAETAAEMQRITPSVVTALQGNQSWTSWGPTQAAQIAHWGTHGFANLITGGGTDTGTGSGATLTAANSSGVPANSVACINTLAEYGTQHPSIIPTAQFFGWFFQPCILKRAGLMILGTGLIIFGLKQLGVRGPANQVIQARDKVFVGSGVQAPNLPKFKADVPVDKPSPKTVAEQAPAAPSPKIRSTTPSGRPAKPREIGKVIS